MLSARKNNIMSCMGVYHPKTSRYWWGHFQHKTQRRFLNLGVTYRGKVADRQLAESIFHKKRDEFVRAIELGVDLNPRLTLKALADEYLSLHSKAHKKSYKNDLTIFRTFYRHFGEDCEIRRLTPHRLEQYKADRTAETFRGKQVSLVRVKRELATLSSMFSKAVLWGRVLDNPVKRVQSIPENNGRERFLTKEEKEALLTKATNWLRPILIFALNTGMRQGEIIDLKWQDVNLDQNDIFIQNSKSGKSRHIPINSTLAELLKRHPKRGQWVFCDSEGRKLIRSGLIRGEFERTAFKLEQKGIPKFTFHDLRHTFGSDLAMKGADAVTIKELMGHCSLRMTERYMHLAPSHKRIAVELLSALNVTSMCEPSVNVAQSAKHENSRKPL